MIKIRDEDLVAIVLQVGSFQTIVRDLVNKHDVVLPNSKLRLARVEAFLLSRLNWKRELREFEDFWFGYGTDPEKIKAMLEEAWSKAVGDRMAHLKDIRLFNRQQGNAVTTESVGVCPTHSNLSTPFDRGGKKYSGACLSTSREARTRVGNHLPPLTSDEFSQGLDRTIRGLHA